MLRKPCPLASAKRKACTKHVKATLNDCEQLLCASLLDVAAAFSGASGTRYTLQEIPVAEYTLSHRDRHCGGR
ncbi:hypothetical protein AAVH_21790 [Aphelenchoides avenae]|nr:hypothetical protein AAVH_21790 [Aphelenchus avenae]